MNNYNEMQEILKEADKTNEINDLINSREYDPNKHFIKENNTMNTNEEYTPYTIRGDITTKQLKVIANAYADLDMEPTTLGFKDNDLNESELKLYATKLMEYKHLHEDLLIIYEGGYSNILRQEKYYNFYNKYKKFIVNKGPSIGELQAQIANMQVELKTANSRLENAATCYRELRDFALMVTETYLDHCPKSFKISDTATYNGKEYKPGKLVNINKIPMSILAAYVNTLADYNI